ncbi:lysozyme inhibitor LprI family protein [Tropicimonas sp. IMCC34043]|uniref:lysozyme inhibitor LprI family protein n=1 Tax=Tropicimonas sp. IMCC34043 TaxID=2248760 RepID=UPI0013008EEF|nr:lysozyme inhibitor LprI family protein [Tropicimonas sp. IMCC34043]
MRLTCLVVAVTLAVPVPIHAQTLPFSPSQTADCLKKSPTRAKRRDCVGASAEACRVKLKSNAPADIALCMTSETAFWDKRMGEAYDAMQRKAAEADAQFDTAKNTTAAPFKLTDDLAAQMAAWKDWRQKTCAVEAMLRRGTPYGVTAAASCMMKLTGEQALFLEKALAYR